MELNVTNHSKEDQVVEDREVGEHKVVLRAKSKTGTKFVHIIKNILALYNDLSSWWGEEPWKSFNILYWKRYQQYVIKNILLYGCSLIINLIWIIINLKRISIWKLLSQEFQPDYQNPVSGRGNYSLGKPKDNYFQSGGGGLSILK